MLSSTEFQFGPIVQWYVTEGTKVKSLFYLEIEFPHHASLYALF